MGKGDRASSWEGEPTERCWCPERAIWIPTSPSSVDRGSEGLHFFLRHWNQDWRRAAEVQWRHIQRRCRWGSHGQWCCRRKQCWPHSLGRSQLGVEAPEGGGESGARSQPHSFVCSIAKLSRSHSWGWAKTAPSSARSLYKPPGPRPPFPSHLPPSKLFQSQSAGYPGPWDRYQISPHFQALPAGCFQASLVSDSPKGWAMDWLYVDPEWRVLQREDYSQARRVWGVSDPVSVVGGWGWKGDPEPHWVRKWPLANSDPCPDLRGNHLPYFCPCPAYSDLPSLRHPGMHCEASLSPFTPRQASPTTLVLASPPHVLSIFLTPGT